MDSVADAELLANLAKPAIPLLLHGLRLWASVCLALYVAFRLQLGDAFWAGTTAALVCQPRLGASLRKGWFRLIGTLSGALVIFVISVCFPQQRAAFLLSLAVWCGACALVATLLRNFAAYAAALAGYTAVIIASDELGATGGTSGQIFMLTVDRASEIALGIVAAGVVLGLTDLGGARRRLADQLAALSVQITRGVTGMLKLAGSQLPDTQTVRRDLIRQVAALDPAIDEAVGESAELLYHSPILQRAVDGLLAALVAWRAMARELPRDAPEEARRNARAVLQSFPSQLRIPPRPDEPDRWCEVPRRLRQSCRAAIRRLHRLPLDTPSGRLLADQSARFLTGIAEALSGLVLVVAGRPGRVKPGRTSQLRVADWLPPLVNAVRAFAAVAAAELFWIITAWPSGASAITWTAIPVLLFAPRAERAYGAAVSFATGTVIAAMFAALVLFGLLPRVTTFAGFCLVMGLYLVPVGALSAQSWQTAIFTPMAANFVPFIAPSNEMSYDPLRFYNGALAIVAGGAAAALAFRLLPSPSPAYRARRLLSLTLRDLRRLAAGELPRELARWRTRTYGRVEALPEEATPLQRARVLAALTVGAELIRLGHFLHHLLVPRSGERPALTPEASQRLLQDHEQALQWVTQGAPLQARDCLERVDAVLASVGGTSSGHIALRARGSILVLAGTLTQHAAYFEAEALE